MTPSIDAGVPRFKPSRAGVIHLWDYLDEEFVFADGRLVLRGHNGSGKTKALEVLFPFILDGQTSSKRVDPFSGQGRSMKDNLLFQGQDVAHGYVWMEFLRPTPDGPLTVTLIIGMRVRRDWARPKLTFFITDKRLGTEFGLLTGDGRPVAAKTLAAVLGAEARFVDDRAYREAIASRLFNLPVDRYHQLLDLLLALRKPMLAQGLNLKEVTGTLTAGLSPIDEALVEQAARDFDSLHAVQAEYQKLQAADEAVAGFMSDYESYLRTVARAGVDRLQEQIDRAARQTTSMNKVRREATTAEREERRARQRLDDLSIPLTTAKARIDVLGNDKALASHKDMVRERELLNREDASLQEENKRLTRSAATIAQLTTEANEFDQELAKQRHAEGRELRRLHDLAAQTGIDNDDMGPVDSGADLAATGAARVAVRMADLEEVRQRLGEQDEAAQAVQVRRDEKETLSAELDELAESVQSAQSATQRERETTLGELTTWARSWAGGSSPITDDVTTALAYRVRELDQAGPDDLRNLFTNLTERRKGDAQQELLAAAAALTGAEEQLQALRDEREQVQALRHEAPPAHSERPADRSARPGAALWQVTRFSDHISAAQAAGIEGALLAAGLLTAWIRPDQGTEGAWSAMPQDDGFLIPLPPPHRPSERTLADVLEPEASELVPADIVHAILSSIAVVDVFAIADGKPAVSTEGQFASGVLAGSLIKTEAEYIGEKYRAQRRAARLARLDADIATADRRRETCLGGVEAAEKILEFLERSRTDLPEIGEIIKATAVQNKAAILHADGGRRLTRSSKALDDAVAKLTASQRTARTAATQRRLPATSEALEQVAKATQEFLTLAVQLAEHRARLAADESQLGERRGRIENLTLEHDRDREDHQGRVEEHAERAADFGAREEAIGLDYETAQRQLAEAKEALRSITDERRRCDDTATTQRDAKIAATTTAEQLRTQLQETIEELLGLLHAFTPVAAADIKTALAITVSEPWPSRWPDTSQILEGIEAAISADSWAGPGRKALLSCLPTDCITHIEAFRHVTQTDETTADSATQATEAIWLSYRKLEDALKIGDEGYQAQILPQVPVSVEITASDGRYSIVSFAEQIHQEAAAQAVLLDERERTVLENELLTAIAQEIHVKKRSATELVKAMNADTMARPMSSGITIGIGWIQAPNLTMSQIDVTDILQQDARMLGNQALDDLRTLIRGMVRSHKMRHDRDPYLEILREVLDYRTWYTFELRMKRPGGKLEKLTAKAHGNLSGGEKSAAIHLPLFAAANAIYTSADPVCPRMVALDEAFAGIDAKYVPDLYELTVLFDLDIFITGHDLWIKYPSVPMAAHYDLLHDEQNHTVSTYLMVWDGAQIIDAAAGFGGNEQLAAHILGGELTRTVPRALSGPTLLEIDTADDDGDEEADNS